MLWLPLTEDQTSYDFFKKYLNDDVKKLWDANHVAARQIHIHNGMNAVPLRW